MPRKKRDNPFALRLTTDERNRATAEAARIGVSCAAWFKAAAFNQPPPRSARRLSVDTVELARLMPAIGKIGSNVNQLAYVANTGSWPDSRAIAQAVADIRWMRDSVARALGFTPPPDPAP